MRGRNEKTKSGEKKIERTKRSKRIGGSFRAGLICSDLSLD